MGVVFGLADKIAVLVYGQVIAFDTPDAVRANPRVQEAYLGSVLADAQVATPAIDATPSMLKLDNVHAFYGKSHVLHGVHFEVRTGEIVALLGRNGSGRSTTVKTIMGLVDGAGSITWREPGRSSAARPSRSPTPASATCPRTATSFRT